MTLLEARWLMRLAVSDALLGRALESLGLCSSGDASSDSGVWSRATPRRNPVPVPMPNKGLQATAYSVRYAPASRRA